MKISRGAKDLKIGRSVLTVGVFDGMHIGHIKIIDKVVRYARRNGMKSVVVTFDPHPAKVLCHGTAGVPSLISLQHRASLIAGRGVDHLVILNFTKVFSGLLPEEFVKNILVDRLGTKAIFVGDNFYFGHGASANIKALRDISDKFDFDVHVVRCVKIGGIVASSSIIRKLIRRGDIRKAAKFLGRPVSILGTVVRGANLASRLGYPTANVNPHHEVVPPSGVYAVKVCFGGRSFRGVLNIGTRPTFYAPRDREPAIEVHIFDFNRKIYGKDIELLFVKKIRDEFRFRERNELISKIKTDIRTARAILR